MRVARAVIAVVALALIGLAIWLTYQPVEPEPDHPPFIEVECEALLPIPDGTQGCGTTLGERAVQVSALLAIGVLGLFTAVRLPRADTSGWPRRLPWSIGAGLIVPIMAVAGARWAQQHDHFVTGIPVALVVPGLLVVLAGCVSLVRRPWPTLGLGIAVGLAQAVPLTFLIGVIWSRHGA